ncbi:PSBP3 [Auxenochlorella protothecoides x Auxenochlorella symbiontica]
MQLAPCTSQGVGSGVGPHVAPVGRTIKCRHARGCNRDQAHTACRSASMKTWARSEGPSEHGMAAYSLESENGAASQGSSMAATPGSSHRRHLLQSSLLAGAFLFCRPGASLAANKGAFVPLKDTQDGYSLLYPFGWQEVTVRGQDQVFKDVIEPLESVAVAVVPTDKQTVSDFGSPAEVAVTLADRVLSAPGQEVRLIKAEKSTRDEREYYRFEFVAKGKTFQRHALVAVAVGNGNFYTLVTGSNERRWNKMQDKLNTIIDSFTVGNSYMAET